MTPTNAIEQIIPLNLLVSWGLNPRKTRDKADIIQMAASTAAIGQQAPLIVFAGPGETIYQVIEGETRRSAFDLNATNGVIAPDFGVRCWVLPENTPNDQLLAVAVASNTVRRQMNPIEEMEAFHSLAISGLKLNAIADMFAVDIRTIRQRLALGDLIESARDLVRSGQRQMGWAQAMTLGSEAAQDRIVSEIQANPAAYADAISVKAELTRGHIPVGSALFEPSELADCLVCDLFSQQGDHFTDVNAFWTRQNVEIQKTIAELQKTHAAVKLFDRIRFDDAGWTSGGVEADSTAVVITFDDGSVEIRKGLIPPATMTADDDEGDFLTDANEFYGRELDDDVVNTQPQTGAATTPSSASNAAGTVINKVATNPLDNPTKDTSSYLTAQIAAALKLAVASCPRLSMAFIVASALTRRGPTTALQIAGLTLDSRDQTTSVFTFLQNKRAARDRIAHDAKIAGVTSPAIIIEKLMGLEDGLLEQLFAFTVSDAVAVGLDESTFDIFQAVGAEVLTGWQIEENYLKTLTNAQIRALATEVIKPEDQPSPRAARGLVEKAILESVNTDALTGNFMSDTVSWVPPQIAYALAAAEDRRQDCQDPDQNMIAQAA